MSERERNGDLIWRASNPGGREGVAVRRAPFLATAHNARDGKRYRGGQCIAKTASHATIKFDAEAQWQVTEVVALEMMPTIRVGDPAVVELASSGYSIAALHDGQFAGAGPTNQEQSVAAGQYHPSRITDQFWNL
jgi:hypothetical protein